MRLAYTYAPCVALAIRRHIAVPWEHRDAESAARLHRLISYWVCRTAPRRVYRLRILALSHHGRRRQRSFARWNRLRALKRLETPEQMSPFLTIVVLREQTPKQPTIDPGHSPHAPPVDLAVTSAPMRGEAIAA